MKKRKKPHTFTLFEIRKAMRRWKKVWMEDREFQIDWHNFKQDLLDVKTGSEPGKE
jgi:hypothetical protein